MANTKRLCWEQSSSDIEDDLPRFLSAWRRESIALEIAQEPAVNLLRRMATNGFGNPNNKIFGDQVSTIIYLRVRSTLVLGATRDDITFRNLEDKSLPIL